MSRPGINSPLRYLFFLPLFLSTYCGAVQVLGTSRREALEFLRMGDTGFIRRAELPEDLSLAASRLKELSRVHPAAPFYAGLLLLEGENAPGENNGARSPGELGTLLLSAALESPSAAVRREAALKLVPLILSGSAEALPDFGKIRGDADVLIMPRAARLYRQGRYREAAKLFPEIFPAAPPLAARNSSGTDPAATWKKALALFSSWRSDPAGNAETLKREIAVFLFTTPQCEALRWAYEEAISLDGLLDAAEAGALSLRLSPGNYRAALDNLRPALLNGSDVFFRYPNLIADLGRAYQYTPAARDEGIALFRFWDSLAETGEDAAPPSFLTEADEAADYRGIAAFIKTLDDEGIKGPRYMLLFYLGRMERANENYGESSDCFARALAFAPDGTQSDACIWYMLSNAMTSSPSAAAELARSTVSQWTDVSYFADILDRLSSYLVGKRQWNTLMEIFLRLESKESGASLAQYAWILGRAREEGYLETARAAEDFFRVAFNAESGSYYYRALAASRLGKAFTSEWEKSGAGKTALLSAGENSRGLVFSKTGNDEADFILGFFEYGAADFVGPYLESVEKKLSAPHLREIAGALAFSGRVKESLELVSRYTSRDDYEPDIQDLVLHHPRPFLESMEKHAREMGLEPEMLYGLVRTESYFTPGVVSWAGAVGLMQLMPPTAEEMAARIARQGGPDYREGGVDLENPDINIHIGSYYLRYLIDLMEDPALALLAYNGGLGRVRRWLAADKQRGGLPRDLFPETVEYTETREYGRRVLSAAAVYGALYYGKTMEDTAALFYR